MMRDFDLDTIRVFALAHILNLREHSHSPHKIIHDATSNRTTNHKPRTLKNFFDSSDM
jgi:hypothetical protein